MTHEIAPVSWFAVAVTYVAGVGLVSRSMTILISALLTAAGVAFVYGVDMQIAFDYTRFAKDVRTLRLDAGPAIWAIAIGSAVYLVERIWRHLIDDKPFLES